MFCVRLNESAFILEMALAFDEKYMEYINELYERADRKNIFKPEELLFMLDGRMLEDILESKDFINRNIVFYIEEGKA